ncbi:hypothetical protein V5799_005975 [Amblyomma americanum]|uniref:Triglyceride lipase-cholesterol esterase n=1 Tax=Amblyomma americanum TaxID=6943 RepID=A0AAQ4DXN6_AMBAM
MISYDLPAMLDFVLNKTGQEKLFFVGTSQGAMILFGLLADKPEYNEKLQTRLQVTVRFTDLAISAAICEAKYANLNSLATGRNNERTRVGPATPHSQDTPPEYNLSRVSAPVALYWSRSDWLADPQDVSQLRNRLPRLVLDFQVQEPSFTHLDFTVGVGARRLVYEPVMKAMASVRTLVHHFYRAPRDSCSLCSSGSTA